MPYTTGSLATNTFYQEIARRDEVEYKKLIEERTTSGVVENGVLRDRKNKKIILFEKIIPGEGTDGTSHFPNHSRSYEDGYFKYEETEDTNKIINREFTEF